MPPYNEEYSRNNFSTAVHNKLESMNHNYKIIFCDDGSNDKTKEKLEYYSQRMPMEIISHRFNRGLGETVRDLFEKVAEDSNDDVIVRLDCDDIHEPEYFEKLITKLNDNYDVVIASRLVKGGRQGGVNPYRAFISYCATIFMKIFFPVPRLKEYACAYRTCRTSKIKKAVNLYKNNFIQLKGLGFTCTLEKIIKLKILKAKFAEIPFVLRYDKKKSTSKIVSSITTFGYLTMALLYHWPWGDGDEGIKNYGSSPICVGRMN